MERNGIETLIRLIKENQQANGNNKASAGFVYESDRILKEREERVAVKFV